MAKGKSLGKAYVQIVPSAEGIKGSLESVMNSEGVNSGKSFSSAFSKAAPARSAPIPSHHAYPLAEAVKAPDKGLEAPVDFRCYVMVGSASRRCIATMTAQARLVNPCLHAGCAR